ANYEAASGHAAILINQAKATVAVTCPTTAQTYTGSAIEACTANVTGANLNVSVTPVYANNVNVGTATASYTFDGDANHTGSNDSKTFAIAKATATVTLNGLNQTYTGAPKSAGATTNATGTSSFTFTYDGAATPPTAAGSYAVVAMLVNDNFSGTTSGTLVIGKATATVTLTGLSPTYTGTAMTVGATTAATGTS